MTLRKKYPYSVLFWSAFFPRFPTFGLNTERYSYLSVFRPNAGKCRKNTDQNNSELGHFLSSVKNWKSQIQINSSYLSFIDFPSETNKRCHKKRFVLKTQKLLFFLHNPLIPGGNKRSYVLKQSKSYIGPSIWNNLPD